MCPWASLKAYNDNGFYLDAGSATNTCFLSSYRLEFDNDDNIDVALSELYEKIIEDRGSFKDEDTRL